MEGGDWPDAQATRTASVLHPIRAFCEKVGKGPKREKRHRLKVASRFLYAGHWPPSLVKGSGCLHRSNFGLPGWLSLLRAAQWRLLVPGTLCSSGSLGLPSAADQSLAPITLAINMPFVT